MDYDQSTRQIPFPTSRFRRLVLALTLGWISVLGGCASAPSPQIRIAGKNISLFGPPKPPYALSGNVATFTVRINERMNDGTSWRGSGAVFYSLPGGITPQFEVKNAPSPLLYVVDSTGAWFFIGDPNDRDSVGHPNSPCHLSYECDFVDVSLPAGDLFAVVFASTGLIAGDLVDAVIISRSKMTTRDPAYIAFNTTLHQTVEKIVVSNTDSERRRRQRPFPLVAIDECAVAFCALRQSTIRIELP